MAALESPEGHRPSAPPPCRPWVVPLEAGRTPIPAVTFVDLDIAGDDSSEYDYSNSGENNYFANQDDRRICYV